jgi:thymidylate synthase
VRLKSHGHAWARGAVVNELVDLSGMQYAVIEALRTEADPERFVIAYRNEQLLHDVIAAPCIIAFGFSSREEAVMSTAACASAAAA